MNLDTYGIFLLIVGVLAAFCGLYAAAYLIFEDRAGLQRGRDYCRLCGARLVPVERIRK